MATSSNHGGSGREQAAAIGLFALGSVFVLAALMVWFTGSHEWELAGIKIRLHTWHKPWWIGAGLWAAAFMAPARPFPLSVKVSRALDAVTAALRLDAGTAARRWSLWGLFLGSFAATLGSVHYAFLFPTFLHKAALIASVSVLCVLAHRLFVFATDLLPASRSSGVRLALYTLGWAALVHWPLSLWEARFTEPLIRQGAGVLLICAAASWIVFSDSRRLGATRTLNVAGGVLLICAACAYSWLWSRPASGSEEGPRERVVLITIDTVRADHLSCYGYSRRTSPEIDAFAATGVRFERAFCPMGITDPSHVSMLTGSYPRSHGVLDPFNGLVTGKVESLPEHFRDKGFATAAITSRVVLDPQSLGLGGFDLVSVPRGAYETSAPEAYRRSANWLTRHRYSDFFLWVHFFDPHSPYRPHPGFPIRFIKEDRGQKGSDKWLAPDKSYSAKDVRYRINLYDGEIAYLDFWVGKLISLVRSMPGETERPALIIISADHGEILDEAQERPVHYAFGHGGILYNGVARVPLMISRPGLIPAAETVKDVVELVDLAPTIADYALGESDFPCQGDDLRPVIEGETQTDGTAVLERRRFQGNPARDFLAKKQHVIVRWPYKLFVTEGGGVELFDLSRDWMEKNDLSSSRPDLVEKLGAELEDWKLKTPKASMGDRNLTPVELDRLKALGYIQ